MNDYSPLISTPLLAFVTAIFLHLIALKIFPRLHLVDFPGRYGLKRSPLPYPSGILCVISFFLLFSVFFDVGLQAIGIWLAVVLLAITTFIDDRRQLPSLLRLGIQLLAGILIFSTGDCTGGRVCSVTNPLQDIFGGPIIELNGSLPVLSLLVTVFWLMLTTNALNWFDGIPGQTSVISCIGFLTIGFLSMSDRVDQPALAIIALSLAAISGASVLFTMPPPLMILGDSGSMFFGFMLGILTIIAGGKVATAFLALGVPIIDLLFVTITRILSGKSPFKGSMRGEHLHHLLLEKGWSQGRIILATALIGSAFGVSALFLSTEQKFLAAISLFILMACFHLYARKGKM